MRTLIKQILNEETKDRLKEYWFKVWNKIESEGEIPKINRKLIKRLGLFSKINEIESYYVEFMGGKEKILEMLKDSLMGKTFSTRDLPSVGGYDFEFELIRLINLDPDLKFEFVMRRGTVETIMTDNETYNLKDWDSIPEEIAWEIDLEVQDILYDFTTRIVYDFAIDYRDIYVEWV
jgi:hypothetical protein